MSEMTFYHVRKNNKQIIMKFDYDMEEKNNRIVQGLSNSWLSIELIS